MHFTKFDSQKVKGLALVMLYFHHMFLDESRFVGYEVDFIPFSVEQVTFVAAFFKICVGIYTFISAYGITLSIKGRYKTYRLDAKQTFVAISNRYISLMMGFIFIYVLALLSSIPFKHYEVYGEGTKSIAYAFIDMLGLAHLYKTPTMNSTWWYMSLAMLVILVMPLLLRLYQSYSVLIIPIALFIPRAMGMSQSFEFVRWLPCLAFGIVFADMDLFYKIKSIKFKGSKIVKLIISLILLVAIMIVRQSKVGTQVLGLFEAIPAVFFSYFCYEFLNDLPVVNKVLLFLGKHSTNLFLIHTFIRYYYFQDFIYSFKYAFVDFLALFATTIPISMLIDFIQKKIKFPQIIKWVQTKILNTFDKLMQSQEESVL